MVQRAGLFAALLLLGTDFTAASAQVTFAPGQTRYAIFCEYAIPFRNINKSFTQNNHNLV